jgi:hypothetical protein
MGETESMQRKNEVETLSRSDLLRLEGMQRGTFFSYPLNILGVSHQARHLRPVLKTQDCILSA